MSPNGPRSRQTELANHRSGGLGARERIALLRRAPRAELSYLVRWADRPSIWEMPGQAGCDPDTLSFIHTVRIVRRHLPFHAAFSPSTAGADE